MRGDCMKMLMLLLPFMVLDLIAPVVLQYMHVPSMYCADICLYWYVLGWEHQ